MTVDTEKVRTKIQFLRDSLGHLERIRSLGEEAFLSDSILQAATVRYLQVGIEAMLDIASHVIAREGLGAPETYRQSMEVLLQNGILPADRAEAFLGMIGFRNRVVHLYESVDPGEVARILESHLGDFEAFISAVSRRYFS
jgi:uncharacterized protein YutE (UPF0331/DUF86 family)